jgi:hypothetical protein
MAGQEISFPISLTPVNGYRGPVNVSCDASTLGTNCPITPSGSVSLDPGNLVNGSATVTATLTVPALASAQVITITINSSDFTYGVPSHTLQITLTIGEFRIFVPYISQTVHAGETAHFELDYTPPNQTVTGNVTFSCGALPALSRCSFAPNPIAANAPATVTLSIATTAPVAALAPRAFNNSILFACLSLLPIGAFLYAEPRRSASRKRTLARWLCLLLLVVALIGFVHCGGGNGGGGGGAPYVAPSQSGTPVGTYTITVAAQSGTARRTFNLTLTVQ